MRRLAGCVAVLCALGGEALAVPAAQPPSMVPDASNAQLGARVALGVAPVWRPVSNRTGYPAAAPPSTQQAARPAQMVRLWDQITGRSAVSAIKVCYSDFGAQVIAGGATSEGDPSSGLNVTASVELSPTVVTGSWAAASTSILIPVFFNGARLATISPGGTACSDPVFYPFAKNQNFYTRTWYGPSVVGAPFPVTRGYSGTAAFTETINSSYFQGAKFNTATTAATSVTGTIATTGSQVVTLPLVPGSLQFYGGSITGYANDDGAGTITGTGVATGSTVNYTTGAVSLNLLTATAPNSITVLGYGNNGATPPDQTLVPVPTNTNTQFPGAVLAPSAILGLLPAAGPAAPLGILAVGDSIIYGSGNSGDAGQSWVSYAATQVGVIRAGQPSETAATFAQAANSRRRLSLANGLYDRVIEDYGTNDMINASLPLATLQANKLMIWANLATLTPHGARDIYAVPILPRTVSSSSQAPLNGNYGPGTVASGAPSLRNAYNAWLCTQVGVTIGGVIDVNAAVENTPATCAGAGDGQWRSLANTSDGTHPNLLGNQAIAAVVGYGGTAASPVFAP